MSISLVSPDVEKQLLSSMMANRTSPATAMALGLREDDFGHESHRMIYAAMRDLIDGGGQVDSPTIKARLESSGLLDVIGEDLIDKIQEAACDPSMTTDYVKVLKDRQLRRGINDAVESVLLEIRTTPDTKDLVERVQTHLFRATDSYLNTAYNGIKAREMRQHYWQRITDTDKIPFGFATLNAVNRGRSRGSLTIWAAYPSVGKSTIVRSEGIHVARAGGRVGIFSLEMSDEELMATMLANLSGIDSRKIESGDLNDSQRIVIDACFDELEQLDMTVYADPSLTPSDIKAIQMRERYDLVLVDYLQRFDFTDWIEVGRIAKQFKNLALSSGCCVDLFSQITPPGVEPGQNPFPRASMQNLYGGRASSHEANNIIILNADREQHEGGQWLKTGSGSLYVAKFRGGRAEFDVNVRFNEDKIMWEEA